MSEWDDRHHERFGQPLRDAAVDPHPEDYLAPINAGQADPHGPEVVAPEIHHDGPAGLKPGDVHVDDPAAQEADEKALAEAVLLHNEDKGEAVRAASDDPDADADEADEADEPPAHSASKADWAAYAVANGMSEDEANALTRAELIERHGG